MLLLLLNEQDMKDQMSNSSMQALAERKNRQVRTRKGQCLSATMYILSGVPPLTKLWYGKGLARCSQAVLEPYPFGCPGRAGSQVAASLSQASLRAVSQHSPSVSVFRAGCVQLSALHHPMEREISLLLGGGTSSESMSMKCNPARCWI